MFEIIRRVLESPIDLERELVIVDDCSTDGTRDLYRNWSRNSRTRFRVVLQPVNQGKGRPCAGFKEATGDIILIQDADLEYDPNDYPKLLAPILKDKADVVYGSRFAGGEEHRVLYFWHLVGNRFLTLLSNVFTNLNLTDMETCYKVFRAPVIKNMTLRCNRFGFEPEVTAKIARGGWRVYEVGDYDGRTYGGVRKSWRAAQRRS